MGGGGAVARRRPRPLARAPVPSEERMSRTAGVRARRAACGPTSPASDVPLDDVDVDLEYETPFLERCALALRAIPRGEVVTYGELAALAGAPGRRARRRLVLRPQPPRALRSVPPGRRRSRARLVRLARHRLQAAPPGARRVCACSLRISATSSPRSRRRRLRPARRALRPLPRRRQRAPPRARRGRAAPRSRQLRRRAARLRAAARVRGRVGDPHLPAARLRQGDALPAARGRDARTPTRCCTAPGVLDASHRPLERPPAARASRVAAAAAPTCGARCSAPAR